MISHVNSRFRRASSAQASISKLKSLERNQSADADDARHLVDRYFFVRRWKTGQVHPVINTVNFGSGIRTALAEQIAEL